MPFDRERIKPRLHDLAQKGAFIGTSSWKYSGWQGQLYDSSRYVWRGRYAESRFEKLCLQEYAEVFKTVCVDAAYYKFPDQRFLEPLVSQVPSDFLFAFKVTDHITIKHFPNLPRFGQRAGTVNEHFLNAPLFESAFLAPCKPFQQNIGLLIFEFSRFSKSDFAHGRDFVESLSSFLSSLPKGWRYGVEIRNRNFLQPEYFAMLQSHGVAHIFNSWQNMPSLDEQLALPGSLAQPEFTGARLLLRPGRKYEEAVKLFSPYDRIQDPYPEGRAAGATLLRSALASNGVRKAFIFVNNRFEGNALESIAGIIDQTQSDPLPLLG
jgi:uncharacterized protein YecE (DUF72 family)